CLHGEGAARPFFRVRRHRSSGGPAKKLWCGLRRTDREGEETRRAACHPRAQRRWTSAVRRWPWIRRTTQVVEFVRGRRFLYCVHGRPRTYCSRLQTARYQRLVRRAGVERRAPGSADERNERTDREGTRRRLCGACLRLPGCRGFHHANESRQNLRPIHPRAAQGVRHDTGGRPLRRVHETGRLSARARRENASGDTGPRLERSTRLNESSVMSSITELLLALSCASAPEGQR